MAFDPWDLRRMRLEAHLTLPQLSELLSTDKGHLSRIERNQARCPAPIAVAWAEACGYRLRWVKQDADEEERLLGHLSPADRATIGRLAAVYGQLDGVHRATLLHLLDLWERPEKE